RDQGRRSGRRGRNPGTVAHRRSVMKAFVVEKYGKGGLRAAQVPDPTIGPRDVLVRVSAASINPLDKMVRNGEFKLFLKYKTPFVHQGQPAAMFYVDDVQREYARTKPLGAALPIPPTKVT